ncbi:ATP-binding protein [Desulfobacter latus]|uniref:ATP-binding protein n=1 Tax=Desulfobacter latus TaxID=2292 RepID=A0A850TCE0_9BACT|nr:ATP-binding protein [Desulfobacter latus]NWH05056.1 ATP-binding protein [Desulfobacter latus]
MKKLPIGIDNFKEMITENHCYVDKTDLIHQIISQGKYYFLSRPRRFGKSLLIDTIAEAFQGKKELFSGLFIENSWDWDEKYPVIHIDLAESVIKSPDRLDQRLHRILAIKAEQAGFTLTCSHVDDCFEELIQKLYHKNNRRVVVLVDEYDKPILDNITDPETACELRDGLRNFYSVLKAQGAYLKFVMLTGVSKFSKVSLFSGLNNLEDITLDPQFGTLCGYTHKELETVFQEHIKGLDLDKIRQWYDGYNFLSESVYNPFDVLLYLKKRIFMPYWFETGTPTFLIRLLAEKKLFIPDLEHLIAGEELLGSFDIDFIEPAPLLFQTGYLTIKEKEHLFDHEYVYHLGFPNHEVKKSLTGSILHLLINDIRPLKTGQTTLLKIFKSDRLDELKELFHSFFASIPHDWYRKKDMAGYEGYYCSIVYCYFTALGLDVRAEETTNHGQLDMAVLFNENAYIFEFKVNELTQPSRALDQIKEKKYHEKYTGRDIYLIGIEFSKNDRNITCFEWEKV